MLVKYMESYVRLSEMVCRPPRSRFIFTPRKQVVEKLLELVDSGMIPIVYGPKGSGKTTLLRCLVQVLAKLGVRSLYVGIHASPPVLIGSVDHRVTQIARKLVTNNGLERGSIVVELAKSLGSNALLVVDDFSVGLHEPDIALFLRAVYEGLSAYDNTANLILATDDALVADKLPLYLIGNLVQTLIWHLSRQEAERLISSLRPPLAPETIYSCTGGSPDAIIALLEHKWNVDEWIEARVRPVLEAALEELEESGVKLSSVNPDVLGSRRITRYILMKYNILAPLRGLKLAPIEREEWIGERWAWQLPIYMQLLKARV